MRNLKAILSTMLLVAVATSYSFAQKQTITNKTYSVQPFTIIESNIVGDVIYTQTNKASVRAEGDKDLVDRLMITEKNGVLKLHFEDEKKTKGKKKLTVYISSPNIQQIDVEGVGNWKLEGAVNADNLTINFKGVGNFEAINLLSTNINVSYEGVGNLRLGGIADYLNVLSKGVGNINTQNLKTKKAVVKSEGVGSVKCYASESISLNNSGVGSITYYGNPVVTNLNNSGIGKIKAGK